jgi:hypothetical protein
MSSATPSGTPPSESSGPMGLPVLVPEHAAAHIGNMASTDLQPVMTQSSDFLVKGNI